ncbi:MAG: hypothetical protein WC054_05965 [Candidatus Nanopelagicales bacterium]
MTSPDLLGWALLISLGLCLFNRASSRWVGVPIKHLEILDVSYFSIAIAVFVFGTSDIAADMSRWIAEASTTVILLYSAGSLALRRPFTAQYTALEVPNAAHTRDFARTNWLLTAIWTGVFGVQLGCLVVAKSILDNPDDLLLAWIIPIGSLIAGFVVNGRMTRGLTARHHEAAASSIDPSDRTSP